MAQNASAISSMRPVVCLYVYTDSAVIGCWFSRWGGVETALPGRRSPLMVSSGLPITTQHTHSAFSPHAEPPRLPRCVGLCVLYHQTLSLSSLSRSLYIHHSLLFLQRSQTNEGSLYGKSGRKNTRWDVETSPRPNCGLQGKYKLEGMFLSSCWWLINAWVTFLCLFHHKMRSRGWQNLLRVVHATVLPRGKSHFLRSFPFHSSGGLMKYQLGLRWFS